MAITLTFTALVAASILLLVHVIAIALVIISTLLSTNLAALLVPTLVFSLRIIATWSIIVGSLSVNWQDTSNRTSLIKRLIFVEILSNLSDIFVVCVPAEHHR